MEHAHQWPRLMARPMAAAYCGVSPNSLEPIFKVEPIKLNARRVLYDRQDLDLAIDKLKGYAAPDNQGSEWDEDDN